MNKVKVRGKIINGCAALNRVTWIDELNEEDQQFLKRFLLASGSLKDLANEYGISYPTVRSRLDRLIEKVKVYDRNVNVDAFERKVRMMIADLQIAPGTAKELIAAHKVALTTKG